MEEKKPKEIVKKAYEEIVKEQSDILRTVLLMIHKNTKERAA